MSRRINKAELITKLQQLEGLTNEEKSALLELLNEQKKYGLVWEDSVEDVEEHLRSHIPVLHEVKERALLDGGSDAPNHILIEGDNLDALTALSYTHEGKIDVIYIDPPYNTGNKDFVYNDNYVDTEDGYRHSKWLSFMSNRLKIAKRLLSDRGVIFISIDDNEQATLKLLCDEVFGKDKFVGGIVWFKKRKGSFLSNTLVSLTEYVLPYTKSNDTRLFGGLPDNSESQPIIKRTNGIKTLHFDANVVHSKLPNGWYEPGVYGIGSSASTLHDRIEIRDGLIISSFNISAPFTWSQKFLDEEIDNGTEVYINTRNFQVRVIRKNNISIKAIESFIDGREIGATNEDAYELLKDIFAIDRPFQYSKPVNLVKKLILSATYGLSNSIVLDFFAGSGTTLHATMRLNAEDGGHRQCILVTNNENGICENVTYERNKRVIQGYTTPKGQNVDGLSGNNLRYYRIDHVERKRTHINRMALAQAMTELLQIKDGAYEEQAVFGSLKVKPRYMRYFKGETDVLIVYVPEIIPVLVKEIKAMTLNEKLHVYVAIDGNYAFADDFSNVASKVEVVAIPSAYYNALKHVLPEVAVEQATDDAPSDDDEVLLNEADINDYQD